MEETEQKSEQNNQANDQPKQKSRFDAFTIINLIVVFIIFGVALKYTYLTGALKICANSNGTMVEDDGMKCFIENDNIQILYRCEDKLYKPVAYIPFDLSVIKSENKTNDTKP